METRKKESFYKKFQKKRQKDRFSSDAEIIEQVSRENNYHPDDNLECARYVYWKLASLQKYDREKREATRKHKEEERIRKVKEMEKNQQEQELLEGAIKAEKRDTIDKEILNGEISQEDLADPKYNREGIDHRKFGSIRPR